MPKALTVKRVQRLLSAGVKCKVTDADVRGLMLVVESKTSAFWTLRFQRNHKTSHMGMGSAFDVSLASVRERARRERERLADGIDPLALRRSDKAAKREAEAKRHTFRQVAEACHAALEPQWSSRHHSNEFINSLERYCFPIIGSADIASIDKDQILKVLEQRLPTRVKGATGDVFWNAKAITASRVRERLERVIDFATVRGWRSGDNPCRWRGYLDTVLAAPRKIAPVRHMRSVDYREVPRVVAALSADPDVASKCLQLIILCACRLGEALRARWSEFSDLDAPEPVWLIPATRMKSRREFRIPLSAPAVQLLRSLYTEPDNPHLFISNRTSGHISESTVTLALRRAGCESTIHGFRSSFRVFAEEQANFPAIVAELALHHAVGSAVERAYQRSDLFLKRRKLMEQWGRFVTTPIPADSGKVLALHG
jgi:integrase